MKDTSMPASAQSDTARGRSPRKRVAPPRDAGINDLARLVEAFAPAHRPDTVFGDFVELSALALSNAVDISQREPREARYLQIAGGYSREEMNRFATMLGVLTDIYDVRVRGLIASAGNIATHPDEGLGDVLGQLYMTLGMGNDRTGQVFTPYNVSRMMAAIMIGDGGPGLRRHGFITLCEPACGAGGMVIACAEAMHGCGHNYQRCMHATCIDIDIRCALMTYVQLSLLHIPAIVIHGNSLQCEVRSAWYTPAHVLGGWNARLRRAEAQPVEPEAGKGATGKARGLRERIATGIRSWVSRNQPG